MSHFLASTQEDSIMDDLPIRTSQAADSLDSGPDIWNFSRIDAMKSGGEILFSNKQGQYCVCFVDMVNSTRIVSRLTEHQIRKYYAIFLNSTALIAKNFGATVVKNGGDCLIFYFSKTGNTKSVMPFKDVVNCGLTMIAAHEIINSQLHEEGLPPLDYRISAEYGKVEFAVSSSSQCSDLFGSTINICAKINSKAPPNSMVIGEDLYEILKSLEEYQFDAVGTYDLLGSPDNSHHYRVHLVSSKKQNILNPFLRTSEAH